MVRLARSLTPQVDRVSTYGGCRPSRRNGHRKPNPERDPRSHRGMSGRRGRGDLAIVGESDAPGFPTTADAIAQHRHAAPTSSCCTSAPADASGVKNNWWRMGWFVIERIFGCRDRRGDLARGMEQTLRRLGEVAVQDTSAPQPSKGSAVP